MTTSPRSASLPEARVTVEIPSRLLAAGVWSVHTAAASGPAGSPVPLPAGETEVELRWFVLSPGLAAAASLRVPVAVSPGSLLRLRLPLHDAFDDPRP